MQKKLFSTLTVLSVLVFTACSSGKTNPESEKWNNRITTAFKEVCNRVIEPTFINSSGNEQGMWVNFSYEKVLGMKSNSSLKFKKIDGEWKLDQKMFEIKDSVCK